MKRLKAQFAEEDVQELQELLKSTKDFRLFRRAQALLEIIHGRSILETAKLFSYGESNLRIWVRRFERDGIFGLLDQPRPGRPKKLTEDVEKILLEILEEDPQKYGALYSQWTTAELARVLKEKTNVSLKETSIRRALKKTDLAFTNRFLN